MLRLVDCGGSGDGDQRRVRVLLSRWSVQQRREMASGRAQVNAGVHYYNVKPVSVRRTAAVAEQT